MAIIYALASPELDVIGLTTVFGNAHVETCTVNAFHILDVAGRNDIPVAQGAGRPLAMDYRGAGHVRAWRERTGRHPGRAHRRVRAHALDAAHFIVEQVLAAPGEITLVPIGPLTNIALAMQLCPELPQHLAGMVIMGGNAFCPGNASPAAEANIINDPEAADIVFGADCPIVMCGLDVTERTLMTTQQIADLSAHRQPTCAAGGADLAAATATSTLSRGKTDGIHVHDSTCISYMLAPQHYATVEHPIRVDTGAWRRPWQDVAVDSAPDARRRRGPIGDL